MSKRRVTDDELRITLLARITKGDAFRLDDVAYDERQQTVRHDLAGKTRQQLFADYPTYTHDLK